jgi:hypothetical protein
MTSALGLKLQEAIEANEARKAMAQWNEPTTPMNPTPTLSICEATFNMVRDNPGLTKSKIVALLETQGHKPTSTTSMLSIMIRYGIIIQEEDKVLRAIGNKYKPRTEFNPRLKQKLGPKPKRKEVRMIRRPAPVADVPDVINSPAHYKVGNIETIDFIQAKLTPEEFKGYLKGNVLKYASRAGHKGNPVEDSGKLAWYANRLAEQS